MFVSKKHNKLDIFLVQSLTICVLIRIRYNVYKQLLVVTSIFLVLMITRFIIQKKRKDTTNTIWLSDVYNNNFQDKSTNNLYIKEEEAEQDLINRSFEINALKQAIIGCHPEKTFFIGLDGKWNTGKSTLIKLTKKELPKNIAVVDFDPCKFENCEAMLAGFYNAIAMELNIYNKIKYRKALKLLIENISLDKKFALNYKNILLEAIPNIDINKMICEELEIIDKRLLIIVDNLDRADKDIMNFFIRCTYAVTDFKNTIFLLVYDSNLLNTQLSEIYKTENLFMKKIINLPIKMPETKRAKINDIFNTSLRNLVYGGYIPKESYSEYKIIDCFEDLRSVIRTLNYLMFHSDIIEGLGLNIYDLIGIRYISENDPELYEKIRRSKTILTYSSKDLVSSYEDERRREVEEELKALYNSAKDDFCKEVLCDLFYNVSLIPVLGYINGYKANPDKCNEIDNQYYFDMYFYIEESEYYLCKKNMLKMSDDLIGCTDVRVYEKKIIDEILNNINKNIYCTEILSDLIVNDLDRHNVYMYYLACKNIITREEEHHTYLNKLFFCMFEHLSSKDYKMEIDDIEHDYFMLWVYDLISNNPKKSKRTRSVEERIKKVFNTLDNGKINFLDGRLYKVHNIDLLYKYMSSSEVQEIMLEWLNRSTLCNYLKEHLVERNSIGKGKSQSYISLNEDEKKKVERILEQINEDEIDEETKKMIYIYRKLNSDKKLVTVD